MSCVHLDAVLEINTTKGIQMVKTSSSPYRFNPWDLWRQHTNTWEFRRCNLGRTHIRKNDNDQYFIDWKGVITVIKRGRTKNDTLGMSWAWSQQQPSVSAGTMPGVTVTKWCMCHQQYIMKHNVDIVFNLYVQAGARTQPFDWNLRVASNVLYFWCCDKATAKKGMHQPSKTW